MRALYRPGSEPKAPGAGLEVVTGQLTSPDIMRTLARTQAVILVFGPRLSRRDAPPEVFCGTATENVVSGMETLGIERLVCQTGAMAGDDASNLGFFYRQLRRRYRQRFRAVAMDREAQERVVRQSGLDWLLVRPPYIASGVGDGRLRAGPRVHIGLLSRAFLGDLATFHCDELTGGRFHREAVYVVG